MPTWSRAVRWCWKCIISAHFLHLWRTTGFITRANSSFLLHLSGQFHWLFFQHQYSAMCRRYKFFLLRHRTASIFNHSTSVHSRTSYNFGSHLRSITSTSLVADRETRSHWPSRHLLLASPFPHTWLWTYAFTSLFQSASALCSINLVWIWRRSFTFTAPGFWNRLHVDLRCSSSLNTFKRQLKTHFYTQSAI